MMVYYFFKAKYGLPYFHLKSKSSDKGFKLKNKLYGVIVHGRKHGIHIFIFIYFRLEN